MGMLTVYIHVYLDLYVILHTAGRVGSAAIYGLRGKANVRCFILYPKGRTSAIQERQMTTVPDKNVQCIAIEVCAWSGNMYDRK